jgi:hypothetical protein
LRYNGSRVPGSVLRCKEGFVPLLRSFLPIFIPSFFPRTSDENVGGYEEILWRYKENDLKTEQRIGEPENECKTTNYKFYCNEQKKRREKFQKKGVAKCRALDERNKMFDITEYKGMKNAAYFSQEDRLFAVDWGGFERQ